jgi:hypothetical protein
MSEHQISLIANEKEKHEHDDDENVEGDQSYTLYDYDDYETNTYSTIGINKLDLAPDVDNYKPYTAPSQNEQLTLQKQQQQIHLQNINKQWDKQQYQQQQQHHDQQQEIDLSSKKKYAKEAWPGRKGPPTVAAPSPHLSVNSSPSVASTTPNTKTTSPPTVSTTLSPNGSLTNAAAPLTSPNNKGSATNLAPKRLMI